MNLATPTKGQEQLYPTPNTYKTNHPYQKPPPWCHPFLHNSYNHFLSLHYQNNPSRYQIYLKNVSFPLMQPEEGANQSKNGNTFKIDIFDSK